MYQYFFDDMPTAVTAISPTTEKRGRVKELPSCELGPMATRETMELVRPYYKISDPQVRKRLYESTKAVGAADA